MNESFRKIKYSLPVRIVDSNRELSIFDCILIKKDDQIALREGNSILLNPGDYFILDFGEETCGGIRILCGMNNTIGPNMKLHIRFGESISEASSKLGENGSCNDHSIRDLFIEVPALSDQLIGDTGFRFVRIDILENSSNMYPFKSIYSWEYVNDYIPIIRYTSEDERINDIYNTCLHTINLCMQNRIWDGIKRDRLVWIGDMEPEIHAIMHLYGNVDVVKKTIETAVISNQMPCWVNNIPSYSAWFLLIMYDVYKIVRDFDFVKKYQSYMNEIIKLFNISIEENLDYSRARLPYDIKNFIDWPSYKEDNECERIDANILLLQYVLPKIEEMYDSLKTSNPYLKELISKINKIKINIPSTKVFAAFYQLLHHDDESYQILIKGNSEGMSTFMSYYVLKAIAIKNKSKAAEILKEYYGGMLDIGATSFFEDFDVSWAKESYRIDEINRGKKKDFHADHGKHCYTGFRHSLCHGWSVGPISFLIEEKIK